MNTYQQKLNRWRANGGPKDIFICGLERETMRVDQQGIIAKTPHPRALGLALTNKYITTDFAEALLELVSPTFVSTSEMMRWLHGLHSFVATNLGDELLWPASMPPVLPDADVFAIAEYGESYQGRIKHIYRRGLSLRYGRRMQAIAGIHLNLSFSQSFLRHYNFISECDDCHNTIYFHMLRNYIRHGWLINYLFGGSPAVDKSFFSGQRQPEFLARHGDATYYHPTSTCLRMGRMGYNNRKHRELRVCFNSLEEYIAAIKKLTKRPDEQYRALGLKDAYGQWQQLNTNVLQIENEYYASVRPKAVRAPDQKTLDALERNGTEYLEIRNLDLDPFSPYGISDERIRFMQLFLLYLSLRDSPPISTEECQYIRRLEDEIIMNNLNQDQEFTTLGGAVFNLADSMEQMFTEMEGLAEILDAATAPTAGVSSPSYAAVLKKQRELIDGKAELPAVRQMRMMAEGGSFVELMTELAAEHKRELLEQPQEELAEELKQETQRSIAEEQQILAAQERGAPSSLDEFIAEYLK